MYIVFFSTSDVFAGEEILADHHISCEVVPTPVTDKAYCGVCLKAAKGLDMSLLKRFVCKVIEEEQPCANLLNC